MHVRGCGVCVVGGGGAFVTGVHGRGACVVGECAWQCVCAWQGGMCGRGEFIAGETTTAADGTHPTGMHSCFQH